jgi:uncharacterized protein with PhoU and TrkA domain
MNKDLNDEVIELEHRVSVLELQLKTQMLVMEHLIRRVNIYGQKSNNLRLRNKTKGGIKRSLRTVNKGKE